jgi:hypothetical protein
MLCSFAIQKPVPSHGLARSGYFGWVIHVTTTHVDPYGYFVDPAHGASSHFWVGANGELEQYIDTAEVSWAQMNGNGWYGSIEVDGTVDEYMNVAQIGTLVKLLRWLHDIAEPGQWPYTAVDHGGKGITAHCHFPTGQPDVAWGNHPCPGPLRLGQLPAIAAAADIGGPMITAVTFGDPISGGSWSMKPDGSIFTADGAPYCGGLNAHPEWHAGTGSSETIGGAPWTTGYVIVTFEHADTTGDPFRYYRFAGTPDRVASWLARLNADEAALASLQALVASLPTGGVPGDHDAIVKITAELAAIHGATQ